MVDGRCPRCRGTDIRSWGESKPGLTKIQPSKVRALADKGLTKGQIAKALGVSRSTVIRAMKAA